MSASRATSAILLVVCAAVVSGSTPKWACSLGEKPSGMHLFPLGAAKDDTARAKAEMTDAKLTQADALRLSNIVETHGDAEAAADKNDAKELLKEAAHEVQEAEGQLKNAKKESEQKVSAVNKESLPGVLAAAEKGVLVVFYAPWCGHCKNFVLRGEDGTPESAPIEKLSAQLEAAKGPKVVKFNVDAGALPEGFDVQYIPTIYLVAKSGEKTAFEGDPSDLTDLQKFALGQHEEKSEGGLSDLIPVLTSNATKKVALLQTAHRLHPWASITSEAEKLAGKSKLAALQTKHVGFPTDIDPHGKNLALTSVVNTAEDVSPLGRLSEELDGSLQVKPMNALSSWVEDTPAVRSAPKTRKASLLATYNRDLA